MADDLPTNPGVPTPSIPSMPTGAMPPKKETGKVQPKKETVRISLPPKPSAAPTIRLPTLPPGGPSAAPGIKPAPTAGAPAPSAAPRPPAVATPPRSGAAPAAPAPAAARRPAAPAPAAKSALDTVLVILSFAASVALIVSAVMVFLALP